jgi:hypothetical protein
LLYQLGKYNTKIDLSNQSKRIRDHLLEYQDFSSIQNVINEYDELEFESVLILSKAINAGYWNSIYGFNWTGIEELKFWKTVHSKSKNLTISRLQLLRTFQSTDKKKVTELKSEYISLLKTNPELYYTFISEDLDGIWKEHNELKEACLNAMFIHLSNDMTTEEFNEEVQFQIQKHYNNDKLPKVIEETINQIRKEKAGNNT